MIIHYRKQHYWTLYTYFGKYQSTKFLLWEIARYVPYTEITEWL